jgi:hypothetical protein
MLRARGGLIPNMTVRGSISRLLDGPLPRRALLLFAPTAVAVTMLSGVIYAVVQQDYRQSANDPQLQLAEDAAARLSAGDSPQDVVGNEPSVDIAVSLVPYTIVFDSGGKPLVSSAVLDGSTPVPPIGVLEAATANGRNTITWQPRDGVRSAIAAIPWSSDGQSGTVVVGRSLREVERREDRLLLMVGAGWIATLVGVLVAALAVARLWSRDEPFAADAARSASASIDGPR